MQKNIPIAAAQSGCFFVATVWLRPPDYFLQAAFFLGAAFPAAAQYLP
jgi:hypothetical protein